MRGFLSGKSVKIGDRYGKWVVIESCNGGSSVWLCRCDCGAQKEVRGYNLTSGKSTSCGCGRKGRVVKVPQGDIDFLMKESKDRLQTIMDICGQLHDGAMMAFESDRSRSDVAQCKRIVQRVQNVLAEWLALEREINAPGSTVKTAERKRRWIKKYRTGKQKVEANRKFYEDLCQNLGLEGGR